MNVTEKRYRKVVWFGGVYDLIVNIPFALPGLVVMHLDTMAKFQAWLGLTGQFPVFDPLHLFFLNVFGSVATIWSVLRIVKPEPVFGLTDGTMRAAIACLIGYYLFVWSIPQIVVLFIVPEVLFGIAQLGGYWLYHRSQRHLST